MKQHCRKICEIQRYTALSNTVKHPCNALYFSISGLVQTPFLKQSRYREIRSVTRMFYRVRQCNIPLYFTYHFAVQINMTEISLHHQSISQVKSDQRFEQECIVFTSKIIERIIGRQKQRGKCCHIRSNSSKICLITYNSYE